jgi:hypothetical protein
MGGQTSREAKEASGTLHSRERGKTRLLEDLPRSASHVIESTAESQNTGTDEQASSQ